MIVVCTLLSIQHVMLIHTHNVNMWFMNWVHLCTPSSRLVIIPKESKESNHDFRWYDSMEFMCHSVHAVLCLLSAVLVTVTIRRQEQCNLTNS